MSSTAQSISGTIKDSLSGNPLSFVTVRLLTDSGKIIQTVFSDSLGNFRFGAVDTGSYLLSFSLVGYIAKRSSLISIHKDERVDIGRISLGPEAKQLSAVTVVGKKPLIEKLPDGIVYNAQQDLLTAGATAINVLRKTPMVIVGQDGTPGIRGSTNIRVFIDDKPSELSAPTVADALRQIPAEEIVKVEVILFPSAKYDAEGTDGVINIITRKGKLNGITGNVNLNAGPRYQNINFSADARKNKWVLSGNTGGYFYQNKNGTAVYREEINSNTLKQSDQIKNDGKTFLAGANIIYLPDSLNTIYGGYRFRTYKSKSGHTAMNEYYSDDTIATAYQSNIDVAFGTRLNSMNAGYTGKSKNKNRELKILSSYFSLSEYDRYNLEQVHHALSDYRENYSGNTGTSEFTIQADYSQQVSNRFNIETGLKSNWRKLSSSNDYWVYEPSTEKYDRDEVRSNHFNYDRSIYAVYLNSSLSIKSWQIRIGGRYEQTLLQTTFRDTVLEIPGYKNFIPFILLNKSIGEKQSVRFNYSLQLLRPYLSYLNPTVDYSDSLNIRFGNPYLVPEITYRYELGYSGNAGKFNLNASFFYNHVRNGIENIRYPLGEGVFANTYQNIAKRDVYGLAANVNWRNEKISIGSNITVRYIKLQSGALQSGNQGFQLNSNINISYQFKNGYSLDGQANINSKDILLQGTREGWKYFFLSLNKKMKQDKLMFTIRLETYNRHIVEEYCTDSFFQNTKTRYQNFFVFFGATWKFGKKELKLPPTQQPAAD